MAAAARHRSSRDFLVPPATRANYSAEDRLRWLDDASRAFVCRWPRNKKYYRIILELLWPEESGIPGPHVAEEDIRKVMDYHRRAEGEKPYLDPFRRMRELQGDEGFTCIVKEGKRYQLQSLELEAKREPRVKLSSDFERDIRARYGNRCAVCQTPEPVVVLHPDHKVPRSRGGNNKADNFQPLCPTCNAAKSAICQGCTLRCHTCPWAFPEDHKPIVLSDANTEQIRRLAASREVSASEALNAILDSHFRGKRKS